MGYVVHVLIHFEIIIFASYENPLHGFSLNLVGMYVRFLLGHFVVLHVAIDIKQLSTDCSHSPLV